MHNQAFATLEYDSLCALLKRGAQTPMGRTRAHDLAPLNDLTSLREALQALAEGTELRRRGAAWSFSELADPTEFLARLHVEGAILEPLALLELARLCEQALAARANILTERDTCPALWEIVADLPRELHSIAARVTNKILPNGELDDRASPELARIRNDISRLRSSITRSLEAIMRRSEQAIQDEIVTIRNDRFVIPVKADHRGRVQGVAHGFSSSGATMFVEPLETIDANNDLQNLRETEEREIGKILFTLTEELRRELPALQMAAHAVAELDFIGAKLWLAARFNCVVPTIDEGNHLELIDARHPLLEDNLREHGASVVPVSFQLDATHSVMVISGANAGGKTVVLKTTGLLALMALSGLPVPARHARVPFYASVLADIGDHQSLAANLSTFTAHVANISRMIELCDAPALVLLDEVGTGTDPEEGSALGVAVVDHFRRECGAHVIATTHYSGLKMYAANEDAVINASVEFNDKTLQPTYKLLVGLAGSSSGLEIARRFGFPDRVVRAAATRVNTSTLDATEYLQRIKREAEDAEGLRRALEEERTAVAEKYASLDAQAMKRERERQAAFENELLIAVEAFEKRAGQFVAAIEDRAMRARVEREAKASAAELRREVKRHARPPLATASPTNQSTKEFDRTGNNSVRVVRDGHIMDFHQIANDDQTRQIAPARDIIAGDRVRLRSFGSIGIVDKLKGNDAEVRVGSVRLREKIGNLELLAPAAAPKPETKRSTRAPTSNSTVTNLRMDDADARAELNVIGRTTDEAVDMTDKFLDEAYLNSHHTIRIIHGHGTGALRRAIGEHLRNHLHVARFAQAPNDQGGAGATIVEVKQ